MNNNENLVSTIDTPTPEQIANKAKTQCAEMRGTALYALGELIRTHLEYVTDPEGDCPRSTAAHQAEEIFTYLYDIVKIMILDSFWLDDDSENTDINAVKRERTKESFKDNLEAIKWQCESLTKLIKEALA